MAFSRVKGFQAKLDAQSDFILIDVVKDRSLSLQIAEELSVRHESPQVIVVKNGKVVHTSSHMSIDPKTLVTYL